MGCFHGGLETLQEITMRVNLPLLHDMRGCSKLLMFSILWTNRRYHGPPEALRELLRRLPPDLHYFALSNLGGRS